jgi:hypothetical protein
MSWFDTVRDSGPNSGHQVIVGGRQVPWLHVNGREQLLRLLPPEYWFASAICPENGLVQQKGDNIPQELRMALVIGDAAEPLHDQDGNENGLCGRGTLSFIGSPGNAPIERR